jgi:hypothetical protein
MDELYVLLSGMREEGGTKAVGYGQHSFSKLWLTVEIGDRSLGMAQRLVHRVVSVLAPGIVPTFLTDQLASYGKALSPIFGTG